MNDQLYWLIIGPVLGFLYGWWKVDRAWRMALDDARSVRRSSNDPEMRIAGAMLEGQIRGRRLVGGLIHAAYGLAVGIAFVAIALAFSPN